MAQISALHEDPSLETEFMDQTEIDATIDAIHNDNTTHNKRLSLFDELAEIDQSDLYQSEANDYYFATETNTYYYDVDDAYDDELEHEEEYEKDLQIRKAWQVD